MSNAPGGGGGGGGGGNGKKCFVGSRVWVRVDDPMRVFELAEVTHISTDRVYSVRTIRGEQMEKKLEELQVTHAKGDVVSVEDLLHLSDFSEESLLYSLRERYERDEFYTNVGPILISINPYKWCNSIYSDSHMDRYRGKRKAQVAPHVFLTAENAYRAVVEEREKQSQAIIISGESGAGKTEATKIILRYLSSAGRHSAGPIEPGSPGSPRSPRSPQSPERQTATSLEQKILDANPLLEAFGNAKTVRNDNSSRFGKFIEIEIEKTGLISGARVINYLLEKSRIIRQADGERNYHVFYQLLRGADRALLQDLGLHDMMEHEFDYIAVGSCLSLHVENDVANFQRTVACLHTIGVDDVVQKHMFRTLAGVLMLGNIQFEENANGDGGCVGDEHFSERAADILGLSVDSLKEALCTHVVNVGGEIFHKPVSPAAAKDKRDALAKALYALLFRWLVIRINAGLAGGMQRTLPRTGSMESAQSALAAEASSKNGGNTAANNKFIGILDIYGFEVFDSNSFEQFCINFANEKLQRHFNKHIFEVEQDEYRKEGIDWSRIEFNDNQSCLDLIDTSRTSLLCLLDEECLMPRGSDQSLLRKLHTNHKDRHANYLHPRIGNDTCFGIKHYAGLVEYTVEGFLQKNNDSLSEGLSTLMQESSSAWFQTLFGVAAGASAKARSRKRASSLRPPTVSEQFRKQLNSLLAKLENCDPHFIRCIKPNDFKMPGTFHSQKCLDQLRYAGMLETIRIRDQGYALREFHADFYRRFRVLAPSTANCADLVKHVSKMFGLQDASQWQIGHTKVFLRRELAEQLDRTVLCRITAAARRIAKTFRQFIQRKHCFAAFVIQAFYVRVHFRAVVRKVTVAQGLARRRRARALATMLRQERAEREQQERLRKEELDKLEAERQAKLSVIIDNQHKLEAEQNALSPKPHNATANQAQASVQAVAVSSPPASSNTKKALQEPRPPSSPRPARVVTFKDEVSTERKVDNRPRSPRSPKSPKSPTSPTTPGKVSSATYKATIDQLRQEVQNWRNREQLVVSRVNDLQGFIQVVFGSDVVETKEGDDDEIDVNTLPTESSKPAGKSKSGAESMETAVSELFRATQMNIRTEHVKRQRLTQLEQQLALQVDANRKLEAQLEKLTREATKASAKRERRRSQKGTAAAVNTGSPLDVTPSVSVATADGAENAKPKVRGSKKNAENSLANAGNATITELMRENICLIDELVATRTRHNQVLRKLSQSESRAEHAEQANETLCTLLSWRDEQIETLLNSKSINNLPPHPESDKLQQAVQDLTPYLNELASKMTSKLEAFE